MSNSTRKHVRHWSKHSRPLFDSPLRSLRCVEKVRHDSRRAAKDFMRRRGIVDQEPYDCAGCSGVHLRTKRRPPATG